MNLNPQSLLRAMFDKAVEVADPMQSLANHLPPRPGGRVVVLGGGKASARMAEALEAAWGPCEGLVITRYGYSRPTQGIEVVEASHPVPDEAGMRAAQRMLHLAESLGEDDFALALISGGASSLLAAPSVGITLQEKQALSEALLASGAPIHQLNTVRKALSRIKAGRLAAAAYPARMLSLVISDVPGDDLRYIGSGPTVASPAGLNLEAMQILRSLHINVPASIRAVLDAPSTAPVPNDPRLSRAETQLYAAPMQSLEAAAELGRAAGCHVEILGDAVEGEARKIGSGHAQAALRRQKEGLTQPLILLSGGELTVTRTGDGIGGPNAEYALSMAIALDRAPGIHAIACDTDGVDGAADVAGALFGPDSLLGMTNAAKAALERNDAHGFWDQAGCQVVTGPTLTNVNDFRAILIEP